MAKNQGTIPSNAPQANTTNGRAQSQLDWNAKPRTTTPRREYAWMRSYSLICGTQPHSPFGCGVAQ
jgi:hypothetical protein